jgi:fatty acyl-CoA reductase
LQVLVEKLLRSTEVAKIYLLIRPKKGVATQSRLRFLLDTKIFDRIREENKDVRSVYCMVVTCSGRP